MREDGRGDIVRLANIQGAFRRIVRYTKEGREAFVGSTQAQDAVVRNLEIVGEAPGKLSEALRSESPNVDWAKLRGFASFAKHAYWRVDVDLLWEATQEIPEIDRRVAKIRADREPPKADVKGRPKRSTGRRPASRR